MSNRTTIVPSDFLSDIRVLCDTCGHDIANHSEDKGCECALFQYPPVPITSALTALLRFSADPQPGASRDTLNDALNDIFGRRYSREMKGLLRDAFREGLDRAGIDVVDELVDEKAIRKIWETQTRYTMHIKNDLRSAITGGRVSTIESLQSWFAQNDYRSVMTGRFMAWQGLNAGLARAAKSRSRKVRWTLRPADHCVSCLSRSANEYTYDELMVIGMPGSAQLQCKSNCHCVLEEIR